MFFLTPLWADQLIMDDEIEQMAHFVIKKISKPMGMAKYKIPLYLVETQESNAAAISTGAIVLNTGLIQECQNPEEFIGVMAHEMGHIKKMHVIRFFDTKAYQALVGGSMGLGLILAPLTGGMSLIASMAGVIVAQSDFLARSRVDEFEADQLAVHALKKISWPTKGLETFFERLMKKDFLMNAIWSTHPLSQDRLNRVKEMGTNYKGHLDPSFVKNYQRVRSKILGYVNKKQRHPTYMKELWRILPFDNLTKRIRQSMFWFRRLKAILTIESSKPIFCFQKEMSKKHKHYTSKSCNTLKR